MKVLTSREYGLMIALFRWEPATVLPSHEHVEIEQTFVLQGAPSTGDVISGNYVWRLRGNRYAAGAPRGALVVSFFIKPNKFLQGDLLIARP
jgi:hypothetical protein